MIVVILSGLVLFSAFIGIWGHSFAPLQLFDPRVNSEEVGERNTFFGGIFGYSQNVNFSRFDVVWADDRSPLLNLLPSEAFAKIQWLPTNDTRKLGSSGMQIVYVVKDLNLYFYHAGVFSPVKDPADVGSVRDAISLKLQESFNGLYDDGKNVVWVSFG